MNKNISIVVAHPDDEVIWFAPFFNKTSTTVFNLETSSSNKKIYCLTCANNMIRASEYKEIMHKLSCDAEIFNVSIKRGLSKSNFFEIYKKVKIIYESKPDYVISHCLYGEDHFHPQHITTSIACIILSIKNNIPLITSASNSGLLKNIKNVIKRTNYLSVKSILFIPLKALMIFMDLIFFKKSYLFEADEFVIKNSISTYQSQSLDYERFLRNSFRFAELKLIKKTL